MPLSEAIANKLTPLKPVDHRQWFYCRWIRLDPKLSERGLDGSLFLVIISQAIMVICPLVSIFMPVSAKLRVENCLGALLAIMGVATLYNEYVCRKILSRFYKFLDDFISSPHAQTVKGRAILESGTKAGYNELLFFSRVFIVIFVVIIVSQPLGELIQGNSWKKLPFPWAFPPSDTEQSFWLVYIFQAPGLLVCDFLGIVILSFSSITLQITMLFDVLLSSINDSDERAMADCNASDTANYRVSLVACLRNDIVLHQQLLNELVSISPHLRNTFFTHSVTISLLMACEAYPIVTGNFTVGELMKALSLFLPQIFSWAQMCLKMETMANKNTEVFDAFYNTPWYAAGVEYKRLLLTALTNSRCPIYVKSKVFKDLDATMSTFYSFVVSSFKLLNVIRTLN